MENKNNPLSIPSEIYHLRAGTPVFWLRHTGRKEEGIPVEFVKFIRKRVMVRFTCFGETQYKIVWPHKIQFGGAL